MWVTRNDCDAIFIIGDTMIRKSKIAGSKPCPTGGTTVILSSGKEMSISISPREFIKMFESEAQKKVTK